MSVAIWCSVGTLVVWAFSSVRSERSASSGDLLRQGVVIAIIVAALGKELGEVMGDALGRPFESARAEEVSRGSR